MTQLSSTAVPTPTLGTRLSTSQQTFIQGWVFSVIMAKGPGKKGPDCSLVKYGSQCNLLMVLVPARKKKAQLMGMKGTPFWLIPYFFFLLLCLTFIYLFICVNACGGTLQCMCGDHRTIYRVGSFFPLYECQGSSSSGQSWQQSPVPT